MRIFGTSNNAMRSTRILYRMFATAIAGETAIAATTIPKAKANLGSIPSPHNMSGPQS